MNDNKASLTRQKYISRINNVQDYIEDNLSKELTLNELAEVTYFLNIIFIEFSKASYSKGVYETVKEYIYFQTD